MRVNPDSKNVSIADTSNGTKKRVHNVFLIDASGSMRGGKYSTALMGVNELLQSIAKDQFTDNTITIVEFHDSSIERRIYMDSKFPTSYVGIGADGGTPLNQAIGETCEGVLNDRNNNFSSEDKVLVNVFTDGEENNSRGKYADQYSLSKFLKELESVGFTITFQGTQNEVNYAISHLGMSVTNTSVHDNSTRGIAASFARTASARVMYSKSVSQDEVVTNNFYSKTVEPTEEEKDDK